MGSTGEFMAKFFREVDLVKSGIGKIEASTKRIREITEERMLAVDSETEQSLSRQLGPLVDSTNRQMRETKDLLESMSSSDKKLKDSEARIRDNLCTTLRRKFGDVCKDYQRAQENYKSQIKKNVKRQLEIVKPGITDDEVDGVVRSAGGTGGVYRQAILKSTAADPVKAAYADVADKYQDVLKLEQSVAELHQMFLDFALLTEQQGELLDQIEYQVKSANEYIETGNKDIEVAIVYQKEVRKKWCCIIMIVVVVIAVIVLVVYIQTQSF